jgi:hypothetical protein
MFTRVESCLDVACFLIFIAPPGARKASSPHVQFLWCMSMPLKQAQTMETGVADVFRRSSSFERSAKWVVRGDVAVWGV